MKKNDNLPPEQDAPAYEFIFRGSAAGGCGIPHATSQPDVPIPAADSQQNFRDLIEHWAKARIDGPMQAVARYDDAAKQLVTTGGLMQGVLVAAFSLVGKQDGHAFHIKGWWWAPVGLFLTSLLAFFFCAMKVCWPQPRTNASDVYAFLKNAMDGKAGFGHLDGMMYGWCGEVEEIHRTKRRWLLGQSICFTLCSVLIITLILIPITGR